MSSRPPIGGDRASGPKYFDLSDQGTGKPCDELDQIGLMFGAGFLKKMAEVGLDCAVGNPESLADLRTASDFDQSEQNPQFGRRQLVSLGDGLRPRWGIQRRLVYEQRPQSLR
jgi:hypothetical protein